MALKPEVSLNEFALDVNVDKAALSRIERLKQGIKLNTIVEIANRYNMKASELLKEYEDLYENT